MATCRDIQRQIRETLVSRGVLCGKCGKKKTEGNSESLASSPLPEDVRLLRSKRRMSSSSDETTRDKCSRGPSPEEREGRKRSNRIRLDIAARRDERTKAAKVEEVEEEKGNLGAMKRQIAEEEEERGICFQRGDGRFRRGKDGAKDRGNRAAPLSLHGATILIAVVFKDVLNALILMSSESRSQFSLLLLSSSSSLLLLFFFCFMLLSLAFADLEKNIGEIVMQSYEYCSTPLEENLRCTWSERKQRIYQQRCIQQFDYLHQKYLQLKGQE